ncbi:MAG: HAMP domain-containing histidine kinase [Lachnospiraceae bacterium]|jgi:signal transduction histidine kinase|nr:HAMP domain-containing histidine kinase [Lachnospiraceae bacterium]
MNTIKKAHIQLTLLNGCITTLILITMTLGYLFISESTMMQNRIASYPRDIYPIASYIEQQDIVSNTWLSQLESNNKYYISLMDNGTEFLYNVNRDLSLDERQRVVSAAWELYRADDTPRTTHPLSHDSSYVSYIMELKNDTDGTSAKYYCSVIYIEKNHTFLEVLLAAPLQDLLEQISRQRFLFLGIITLALIAIWIFAWIFTGKLLDPIEANRLRQNQFIASASHELRTPLAVILSCAETELAKKESSELSTIRSESLRTSRLLGDMLTLLSCDTGHLEIKPVSTQLDTLVLNACEAFETMAAARHIRITAVLPENLLPDCLCDSERITQVLAIFLHNAISYTPEGGSITLSVRHRSPHHRSGRHFEIQISDTGVGISDEEKTRIFDRFYRSEKARSDKDHFGLGLSIAYDIITAHHGSITVTDTPGGGTTFIITI